MFSSRFVKNIPVVTYNNKGADAFVSTTNPILDIFTYTQQNLDTDKENFKKLINLITNAKNFNSELFVKLLKFQRLIQKGNGIKHIYYLCLILIKQENPELYSKILEWSYEYPKDILFLNRVNSMFNSNTYFNTIDTISHQKQNHTGKNRKTNLINIFNKQMEYTGKLNNNSMIISDEVKLYGSLVFSNFIKILSGSTNYNPMFIKYLSYEGGHWILETEIIWKYLDQLAIQDDTFNSLVNSEQDVGELGISLRKLLKENKYNNSFFTNKNKRLIKKLFNHHVNLTDNILKGIHTDGSLFYSKANRDEEIEMIYQVIKKTPAKSCEKIIKYIKKNTFSTNPKHKLLNDGYLRYIEKIKTKEVKTKTTGLDLTTKCMEFYQSPVIEDTQLENQLKELVDGIRTYLQDSFNEEFTFDDFASKICLVLDISGSMQGIPINTGLLYFIIMIKLFNINTVYYFETLATELNLTLDDINGSFCSLIKKVYMNVKGSTCLDQAFDLLEKKNVTDKIIMIITDGDCDPIRGSTSNPFHEATVPGKYTYLPTNNYVVVNVKQDKLNFPYLGMDPKVCYVTGNNPKTINGLIKSIIVSKKENISITPELILEYTLNMIELNVPEIIPKLSLQLSDEEIDRLYMVFIKNLPPTTFRHINNNNNNNNNSDYNQYNPNDIDPDNYTDDDIDDMDDNIDDMDDNIDDDSDDYDKYIPNGY